MVGRAMPVSSTPGVLTIITDMIATISTIRTRSIGSAASMGKRREPDAYLGLLRTNVLVSSINRGVAGFLGDQMRELREQ